MGIFDSMGINIPYFMDAVTKVMQGETMGEPSLYPSINTPATNTFHYTASVETLFSPSKIEEYEKEGWITVRYHPQHEGLRILNYTSKTQFEKHWDDVTTNCRGLVIDKYDKIVARPFPKFHNLEDYEDQSFLAKHRCISVQDKMDGSLGILVAYENDVFIATRGSFVSEQAIRATEILHTKHKLFLDRITDKKIYSERPTSITYLFEIVYPENRIVVNYGELEDLILLCGITIHNGWTRLPHKDLDHWDGLRVKEFLDAPISNAESWDSIKHMREDNGNNEGYVLTFEDVVMPRNADFRVKIKYDEYKRLHYLMTNVTERKIWEALVEKRPLTQILTGVPDEYYTWVSDVQEKLLKEFDIIDEHYYKLFNSIKEQLGDAPRKDYAEMFKDNSNHPSILFSMLDGKDYSDYIYKMIKPGPDATAVYRNEEEEI